MTHSLPTRRASDRLVIDALTPMPDRDAGSLRLVNLMRLLRDEGAHVIFLAANRQYAGRYTKALQARSEEHTSELQSLMRISYAVFCLKKKKYTTQNHIKIQKKQKSKHKTSN